MKKIGVIQTAFPGDVILATPVFEALKERYPDAEIIAVVRPESYLILQNNPSIDDILVFDKYGVNKGITGLFHMSRLLKGIDWAVIIQRFFRSAMTAFLAGIKKRTGFDNAQARLLYTERIHYGKDKHEVQRCLDLIGESRYDKYRPKIYTTAESGSRAEELLSVAGIAGDFAVVAPGSVWPTKRYDKYPELIDLIYKRFSMRSILLGGINDMQLAESVYDGTETKPVDLTGETDILVSAEIIARAKVVFTNDSAPAHIAAAMGTPVVAVFGPTVREFGFTPFSEKSAVAEIADLYCRPCSSHGSGKCPERHFKCMKELSAKTIIEKAESFLRQ